MDFIAWESRGKARKFYWKSGRISDRVIALDFLCAVSCSVTVLAANSIIGSVLKSA